MDPVLPAATSGSLFAIQRVQSGQDRFQRQLTTGRTAESPSTGDARAFVLAQGLLERSGNLSQVGTAVGQGIGALQAAGNGIDAISRVVDQLKGIARQAQAASDPAEQSRLEEQYNTLRGQIDAIAGDASYNGVNLIKSGPDTLSIGAAGIDVDGIASDSAALGITAASGWSGNPAGIEADLAGLDQAGLALRSVASELGGSTTRLQIAAEVVQTQAAIARQGADRLTAADINEAAASVQSAETYRQLGLAALRNAGESQDAVLGLFTRP
ncbi:flagellin [Magnetospirillum sp. SS-4]|uniref:flagellin n=1 Tax=Magnetospirillum sp. SS-4 TaxID=2681465 RepID=UPI001384BA44|nr:flagellin [Magnetospirillum sp. SS-4]CAA7623252.1 putative Flagellin gene flaB [Magnetospirillum sp. SS-4]